MKYCIKCGTTITHHHKYCEKHYPKKTATILDLKNENKTIKHILYNCLSFSTNPHKTITKKSLKSQLKKKGIIIEGIQ